MPRFTEEPLLLIGDLNVNILNLDDSRRLFELMARFGLRSLLAPDAVTTDQSTQIDVAFSNITRAQAAIYECATSYHKPIVITI